MVEVPPPPPPPQKKKKGTEPENYRVGATHFVGEVQDLLTTGMDFSDLGMVKIEAEPVPGFEVSCPVGRMAVDQF